MGFFYLIISVEIYLSDRFRLYIAIYKDVLYNHP